MHIHPHATSYSLLMRNKWPAVLSAKGGGLVPTTTQTHIPEAAQGDTARKAPRPLLPQALCGGDAGSGPLSLYQPQPFLLWGTGPGLERGQEGSQSLSHWEGPVGS